MNSVAVIDYGMGNLHSVSKALEHVAENTRVVVSSEGKEILGCDRVVLPGVGAIRDCIAEINSLSQLAGNFARQLQLILLTIIKALSPIARIIKTRGWLMNAAVL